MVDLEQLKSFLMSEDSGLVNVRVGKIEPDPIGIEFTLFPVVEPGEAFDLDLFWADIYDWLDECQDFVGDEYEVFIADIDEETNGITVRIEPWEEEVEEYSNARWF